MNKTKNSEVKDKKIEEIKEVEEIKASEEIEEIEEIDQEIELEETEIDKLNAEIKRLKAEVDRLKNEYAKAYADTENTKKRLIAEAEMERKYRIQSFAREVLPVIDNLERALSQDVTSEEAIGYKKGVQMTYVQLIKALSEEGVEEIEVLDKPFDANEAQAIMVEKKDGVEPGIVIEVLQKGYRLKDRILRPAMVKVSE